MNTSKFPALVIDYNAVAIDELTPCSIPFFCNTLKLKIINPKSDIS